jgi:hypothetical protein
LRSIRDGIDVAAASCADHEGSLAALYDTDAVASPLEIAAPPRPRRLIHVEFTHRPSTTRAIVYQ